MPIRELPLTALIGNTPLLKMTRVAVDLPAHVQVHLKAEWHNPGGSVKDRAALAIVKQAFSDGHLAEGGNLLDATSGNAGIAYAMLGAAMDFRVTLCLPANANMERQKTLQIYGAEIFHTEAAEGTDGAILAAQALRAAHPDRYFYADQYNNPANWKAHYLTTGPEIWRQTQGKLTHCVIGLGSTGTCVGVGRYLRKIATHVRVVAVQPAAPFHGLEGLKHLSSVIVPGIYDANVPHDQATVTTEDAYTLARYLARREGMMIGIAAAGVLHVALELGRALAKVSKPTCIVALAPDGGSRYLSERFWQETA